MPLFWNPTRLLGEQTCLDLTCELHLFRCRRRGCRAAWLRYSSTRSRGSGSSSIGSSTMPCTGLAGAGTGDRSSGGSCSPMGAAASSGGAGAGSIPRSARLMREQSRTSSPCTHRPSATGTSARTCGGRGPDGVEGRGQLQRAIAGRCRESRFAPRRQEEPVAASRVRVRGRGRAGRRRSGRRPRSWSPSSTRS